MEEVFRFKIGEFDCMSVYDGYHDYGIGAFFANVEQDELEPALRAGNWPLDRVSSPYTSLYVDTGDHRVLVDTGAGEFFPTTGRLARNLERAGVDRGEIDQVLITHAHPDHIGGLLNPDGASTYPSAQIYTMASEWDFWLAEDALEKAPGFEDSIRLAHRVFQALGGRFRYIEPYDEPTPGVQILPAFGHTPGHFAVEVSSGGESIIYLSDAVFHPLHIEHLTWLPDARYIADVEQFQATARHLLARAAATNALILGMHFPPFPSMGRVIKTGEALHWEPLPLP
jgi:glyoxylase-like metal-dependent hydrolase (beta-lactamase superfamily II)